MKFPNHQALEKTEPVQLNQLEAEEQVKSYLINNPDFLRKNPQLLSHIELEHNPEGATSLVERQIQVLRQQNNSLQGQLIEMLNIAHNNEKLLIQCNQFMLDLLQTKNLQSLCATIISSLKRDFFLDAAALVLVGDYPDAKPAQIFTHSDEVKSLLNCQFPDSQPICGRLEEAAKKTLFGDLSQELESFAIVPLGKECEFGLLVMGSHDVSRFEPDMDTLFVDLIAKLVMHLTQHYAVS